jgi:hypothetical protein
MPDVDPAISSHVAECCVLIVRQQLPLMVTPLATVKIAITFIEKPLL